MRLFGESEHQLDDKGRINVPKRLQPLFEDGGFLTRSFDGNCLVFWCQDAWDDFQQKMDRIPFTEEAADLISRWVSCGVEMALDGQGRLTIPPILRRHAKLTGEVTLVARGNKMEVWDTATWATYQAEKLTTASIAQALKQIDHRMPGGA